MLDDQGIRVEGVPPRRASRLRGMTCKVLTDDKSSVYASSPRIIASRIPQWAGKELFAELESRVPLRLEKKTWSHAALFRAAAG